MERLWTPWRREFVEGSDKREGECFLCAIPAEHDDRGNLLLLRAERVFVVLNRYPYNTGHLMVAPYAHTGDLANLEAPIAAELMHVTQQSLDVLQQGYRPDGFNIGANIGRDAGAGFAEHMHWHIVPRWEGDGNFISVLASTRVLSQSLEDSFKQLRPLFKTAGADLS